MSNTTTFTPRAGIFFAALTLGAVLLIGSVSISQAQTSASEAHVYTETGWHGGGHGGGGHWGGSRGGHR